MERKERELEGDLWTRVVETTAKALASGALRPIKTTHEIVLDGGVGFIVRVASNLARKRERAERTGAPWEPKRPDNPFLPYERELFVADLTESHLCLLNKFNVLDHHLLLVTRDFEDQEELLTEADFEALWLCLEKVGGLGFYNGGVEGGASQPHKHLQLVPLPLAAGASGLPIDPLLSEATREGSVGRLPSLPFRHAFAELGGPEAPEETPETLLAKYRQLLRDQDLAPEELEGRVRQRAPYNLLVTTRWMLLVPRSLEHFERMSLNALAFAGALLVRDSDELAATKKAGPMTILRHVTIPWGEGR